MWKFSNKKIENNMDIITKEIGLRDESMLDRIDESFREQKQDFQEISDALLKALNTHTEGINKNRNSMTKLEATIEYLKEQLNNK